MITCPYGFRIVGSCINDRRPVDWADAFFGHAACAEKAEVTKEAYLSAFAFGSDFIEHLKSTGSTKGYDGVCASPYIWWDLDCPDDLPSVLDHTRHLAAMIDERFGLHDGDLLVFFSGGKGFHLGLSTSLWTPEPSAIFNRVARRFTERIAEIAKVTTDTGVYDKVRAFRAPNSRHPKSGLHKRRLSFDELLGLSVERILALAKQPAPFDVPAPECKSHQAAADWHDAELAVLQCSEKRQKRRDVAKGVPELNRVTMEFIRNGATKGDRHRLLFSAAANLAEFGCSTALAQALLTESALDSGLCPLDVRRQIECGLQGIIGSSDTAATSLEAIPDPGTFDPLQTSNSEQLRRELATLWSQPAQHAIRSAVENSRQRDKIIARASQPK